jgi:hypothetical protein
VTPDRRALAETEAKNAAAQIQPGVDPFEKEGFVWIGDIGLRFDGSGKFVEAKPAVEPL